MKEDLTFEDGILLCNHIFQNAIEKTLNGVIEQEQIFFKAYEILNKLDYNFDDKRLNELLFKFNMENIYALI